MVRLLVGFHNNGTSDFLVDTIDASLRYPQDFSYHIQNVSLFSKGYFNAFLYQIIFKIFSSLHLVSQKQLNQIEKQHLNMHLHQVKHFHQDHLV